MQCGDQALSASDVERLARTHPGTTFQTQEVVTSVPADTRTGFQKLYKSAPKPTQSSQWRLLGRYVKTSGPFGNPQYNGGYTLEFTNGAVSHDGELSHCGRFAVAHLGRVPASAPPAEPQPEPSAPPVEDDGNPTLPGGRRRRRTSRVKKQTRRTQRKRRNTVRR
jgi:hypothetical protein